MSDVGVLIAGGGPVGTTLAMDLAWRGTPSMVVEQRRHQPPNPRCNTTNARSMEFFRRLGVADEIRAAGLPGDHPTDVVYLTRWEGDELTRYQLPPSSLAKATGPSDAVDDGWPTPEPQHRICQIYLEPILRRRARSMEGLTFREGWRFLSYRHDGDDVVATIEATDEAEDASVGTQEEVRARYLVGAEGARSIVRATMGASFQGRPQVARTLSTFIRCPRLAELNEQWRGWMFRIVGRRRYHRFVAIDGGAQWIYHLTLDFDEDLDGIDVAAELADAIGGPAPFEVLGQVEWIGRAMVADRFSDGNVFLAGDAAHIWIPMGGFGMNAGIADATNLSWKLTASLDGWAGPRLLPSYQTERKPMGEIVANAAVGINTDLHQAMALADGLDLDGPAGAEARQVVGRAIAAANTTEFNSVGMQLGYFYDQSDVIWADGTPPPEFALGTYEVTSWPGARTPHLWLDDGRSLHDALGRHFTLLVLGPTSAGGDVDPAGLVAAATRRGVPLDVFRLPSAEALALYQDHPLVLVRPDQHIGWRGRTAPGDPGAIIDTVRGA